MRSLPFAIVQPSEMEEFGPSSQYGLLTLLILCWFQCDGIQGYWLDTIMPVEPARTETSLFCPQASTYMSCWNQNIMYIYGYMIYKYIYICMLSTYICKYMRVCVAPSRHGIYCSCMKTERRYWYGQFGLQLLGKGCRNASARPLYGCTSFRTDWDPPPSDGKCFVRTFQTTWCLFFPCGKNSGENWIINHEPGSSLWPFWEWLSDPFNN